MKETVKRQWLTDNNEQKIAPYTTIDQVIDPNGKRMDSVWEDYQKDIDTKIQFQNDDIQGIRGVVDQDRQDLQISLDDHTKLVNDAVARSESYIDTNTQTINHRMDTIDARMNTFTTLPEGSTTADAELKDIRIGVNGKTYENAGTAVREQIKNMIVNDFNQRVPIINGSTGNPSNLKAIRTIAIDITQSSKILFSINKPLLAHQEFHVGFTTAKKKNDNNVNLDTRIRNEEYYVAQIKNNTTFQFLKNENYVSFTIALYNTQLKEYEPLRVEDFKENEYITIQELSLINNEIVNKIPFSSRFISLINGSAGNPGNKDVIRTEVFSIQGVQNIKINISRPNKIGYRYLYGYRIANGVIDDNVDFNQIVLDRSYTNDKNIAYNNYITFPKETGLFVVITIAEYNDETQTYNPLRASDFQAYSVTIENMDSTTDYFKQIPDYYKNILLFPGTVGNSSNTEAVRTQAFNTQNFKHFHFKTSRPNRENCEYVFGFSTANNLQNNYIDFKHVIRNVGYNSASSNDTGYFYFDRPNENYAVIEIAERNILTGAFIPLRIQDFQSYTSALTVLDNIYSETPFYNRTSQIFNGSIGNPANKDVVRTEAFPCDSLDEIYVSINRPNRSNCVYHFGWTLSQGRDCSNVDYDQKVEDIQYTSQYQSPFIKFSHPNGRYCSIVIAEYNLQTKTYCPLRVRDFQSYEIKIENINAMQKLLIKEVPFSSRNVILVNGSAGNPGNKDVVRTTVFPCEGKQEFYISTNRPNRPGCVYSYGHSTSLRKKDTNVDYSHIIEDVQYTYEEKKTTGIIAFNRLGGKYCSIIISEYNVSTGQYNPLRIEDFIGYEVTIQDTELINKKIKDFTPQKNTKDILYYNEDIKTALLASMNYGIYAHGHLQPKRFSMLVTTDVHRDQTRLSHAVYYLNQIKHFDCGITLGDIAGSNFSESDGTWYTNTIKNSSKPWLTVIGNHDVGNSADITLAGTEQQVYDKWIRPNQDIGSFISKKSYYFKDFGKIRLICLNVYDIPDTLNDDGNFRFAHACENQYISQSQINWLIKVLQSTPTDMQIMLCQHASSGPCSQNLKIPFNGIQPFGAYDTQNFLPDLINAWKNGTSINQIYPNKIGDVTVNADFGIRGKGIFICYLTGHIHGDIVGNVVKYPDQLVIAFSATANDGWQNAADNLGRNWHEKSEDAITSVSIDTEKKKIYLCRIGANIDVDMNIRQNVVLQY